MNVKDRNKRPVYQKGLIRRMLRYAYPYWKYLAGAALFVAGATAIDLLRPYIVKNVIDNYLAGSTGIPTSQAVQSVVVMGFVYTGLILAGFLLRYFLTYLLNISGQNILFNLRQQIFSHIQRLPLSFFEKNQPGQIITKVISDTEALNALYSNAISMFLVDIMLLIGAVILMLRLSVQLSLVVFLIVPLMFVASYFFRKFAGNANRKYRTCMGNLNSFLAENISGSKLIQVFAREKENMEEMRRINRSYYVAGMNVTMVFAVFGPFIWSMGALTTAIIIWVGGANILQGTLTFGTLYVFVEYIGFLFRPVMELTDMYNALQSSLVSAERMFELLDTPPEMDEGDLDLVREGLRGEIEFKNVWFAYEGENWVLRDVSFRVLPGETLGIAGHTGSGKSTIISLICRFYEIQKGQILLDGIDIRRLRKDALRSSIGLVLQDIFLFGDTVRENIRLGMKGIGERQVEEAAEYVHAVDFINNMEGKYDHVLINGGANISTGQRQLMSFARIFAFNPKILVLDEATASIDSETEKLVQQAMLKASKNRTTIIVAHRLSTIEKADRILVLDRGEVAETGNHQELMKKEGIYYTCVTASSNFTHAK